MKYIVSFLLFLSFSLFTFGLSQENIWVNKPQGGKWQGWKDAKDSSRQGDYYYSFTDGSANTLTSEEFSLGKWKGLLTSYLRFDSLAADTTADDTLHLLCAIEVWDGIDWVQHILTWDTTKTTTYADDNSAAFNDTISLGKADFGTTYIFSTARMQGAKGGDAYLGWADNYYSRIRWVLKFLALSGDTTSAYFRQTFTYYQQAK